MPDTSHLAPRLPGWQFAARSSLATDTRAGRTQAGVTSLPETSAPSRGFSRGKLDGADVDAKIAATKAALDDGLWRMSRWARHGSCRL